MPRAEAGTPKDIANRQRQKGLTKLNFFCPVCQKANRDANAYKMHTQSESHVRKMAVVGENANTWIQSQSSQFKNDFLRLLKTAHGEKQVHINHFYQEYIADRHHIHMNSTKWNSLTEFAKFLGREGICRVEENDKGIHIAWIDDSPEALRRKEAVRRKEQQEHGDEEMEQKMIREQIRRAKAAAEARGDEEDEEEVDRELVRKEGEKLSLSFGAKPTAKSDATTEGVTKTDAGTQKPPEAKDKGKAAEKPAGFGAFKLGGKPQTRNVFGGDDDEEDASTAKKIPQPHKMSAAERIIKEEQERKRGRAGGSGFGFGMPPGKRQKQ